MIFAKDCFLNDNCSKCSFFQIKNSSFITEDMLRFKVTLQNNTNRLYETTY